MNRRRIFLDVVAALLVTGPFCPFIRADEQPDNVEKRPLSAAETADILNVLRQRAEKVHSGRFVWHEDRTIWPETFPAPRNGKLPKELIHSHDLENVFQLAGTKFLFRYFPMDLEDSGKITQPSVHSYDGNVLATYSPPGELFDHGQGIVHRDTRFQEFNNLNLLPFLFAFRPLDADGLALGTASPEAFAAADGTNVLEVKAGRNIRRFFLEPAHHFRLRRFERSESRPTGQNGDEFVLRSVLQIDSYRTDLEAGVDVPERWSMRWMTPDGKPMSETTGTLSNASVNVEAELESFSLIPFPEGSIVLNEKERTKGWQRADGTLEVTASREKLPEPTPQTDRTWPLIGANVLVILLALLVWYGVRRRANK